MTQAKSVMLTVKSNIKMKGQEDQDMELMTLGKFYEKHGSLYLLYEETEVSGMAGDRTMLKLAGDQVTMHRYGENDSELCFEAGKRHRSLYHTPYGPIEMEILASVVTYELNDAGEGFVELVYELSMKGLGETKTHMRVSSKALGGESEPKAAPQGSRYA